MLATACGAQAADAPRPYEIVREDTDLEIAPDGRTWNSTEIHARPLTSQGVQAMQEDTLSYTSGYETLKVKAYTLKKDGRRIDVAQSDILQGHGETSSPGFEDTRTMTVVFPSLEIGDEAVLVTTRVQQVPWFVNTVAATQTFSDDMVVHQQRLTLYTRGDDTAFHIVASGVEAAPTVTANGKTRRIWTWHNDTPRTPEPGEVDEIADVPRVEITNLADYAAVAKIYADLFKDKVAVTPEISDLADKLTAGIKDRRAQAKALYDWVSAHVEYVNIVLGAGGFEPHKAADVLKNGHGDCKDHVILLQALLAAKKIKSAAVLIRAGASQYRLQQAASPFLFDHLINYLPEFKLYADSTARYAPFGTLPSDDAGKTVLLVEEGRTAVTPPDSAAATTTDVQTTLTLNADGSADGDIKVHATGTNAISARASMAILPPERDTEIFRAALGPGSDGKFDRGKPDELGPAFDYGAHFHAAHAARFSGPGAISPLLGYTAIPFTALIGQGLPAERHRDYVCPSGTYRSTINFRLPAGVTVTALPPDVALAAGGVTLKADYRQSAADTVQTHVALTLDRPGPVCKAADYAGQRAALSQMVDALLAQILYK